MKKVILLIASIVIIGSVILAGCASGSVINKDAEISTNYGQLTDNTESIIQIVASQPKQPLNNTDIEGILYMIEEEKLARDVYKYLYDLWGLTVFKNIESSEQTHMNAVLSIISKYGLENPVKDEDYGVFKNEHLQELYNTLTEQGSKSIEDALKVGALIEETDIIDLETYINFTANPDIETVYTNLMNGSENHLRAFVSQLKTRGVTYIPQLLPIDRYNEIIAGTNGNTGKGKGNH